MLKALGTFIISRHNVHRRSVSVVFGAEAGGWRAAAGGAAARAVSTARPPAGPGALAAGGARRARSPARLSIAREPAAAAAPPAPARRCRRPLRPPRHGALHRNRAQVPVLVEHHSHRVPRPGAEGRRLGRGHEGDRLVVSEGSKVEVEEAPRQLPRRAEETERDARQGPRQPYQKELPLEVHGADAVPAAVHEQPQETGQLAAVPRAAAGRGERARRALLLLVRVRGGVRAQAQGLRAAHRHRPQAGLPVQGAVRQAAVPGRGAVQARAGLARRAARASRPARHLLQQHVPVHQTLPFPHTDQDKEDVVQRGDRGGGGAAGGAGELRQPVGGGRGLVLQQRGGLGRRAQAGLSAAPPVRRVRRRRHRSHRTTRPVTAPECVQCTPYGGYAIGLH